MIKVFVHTENLNIDDIATYFRKWDIMPKLKHLYKYFIYYEEMNL